MIPNKIYKTGNYVRHQKRTDNDEFDVIRILSYGGGNFYKARIFGSNSSGVRDSIDAADLKPIPIIEMEPWLLNWDLIDKGDGLFRVAYKDKEGQLLKALLVINKPEKEVCIDLGFMRKKVDYLHELQDFLKEYHEFDLYYAGDETFKESIE